MTAVALVTGVKRGEKMSTQVEPKVAAKIEKIENLGIKANLQVKHKEIKLYKTDKACSFYS